MQCANKYFYLLSMLLPCFAAIQLSSSVSTSCFYPFNPYRMFSKNWESGIIMSRINYRDADKKIYRPWDLLNLPFFQTNSISYATFLDKNIIGHKDGLCKLLMKNSKISALDVVSEEVQFNLVGQVMKTTIVKSNDIYNCKK